MRNPIEKLRLKRLNERARRKSPDKFVGGLPELLLWEEYFILSRGRKGARKAFVGGAACETANGGRNPHTAIIHPIRHRAYLFGLEFVRFFRGQAERGDIKDMKSFLRLHVVPLGVT